MTLTTNKYNKIQLLYSLIKKDDIKSLKKLLISHPEFIQYANKYGKTIFSYAVEKGALKISQFLYEKNPKFLNQQYKNGHDIFLDLISKNNEYGLMTLLTLLPSSQLDNLYHLPRKRPLYFDAIKHLDKKSWSIFYRYCESFITHESLTFTSTKGFNVAHLISLSNKEHCLPILDKAEKNIFSQIDQDTGSTPLLVAAKYSNPSIISYLLSKSNLEATTFLQSNLIYVATLNSDLASFDLLMKQSIDFTYKNSYSYTPLMSAIFEKSAHKSILLFPHYYKEDISEELLEASQHFSTMSSFFTYVLPYLKEHHFLSLKQSPKKIEQLFSNILYSCDDKQLTQVANSSLWSLLENIKDNLYLSHQLYVSSISNRKFMSKKIELLLKNLPILHSDQSEQFYQPIIQGDSLTFQSTEEDNENRLQKSFCLVAALGTLPAGQIKEILEHTSLIKSLNEYDWLLLFSLGLKKKSPYVLNLVMNNFKKVNPGNIDDGSNYDEAIQNNLSHYKLDNTYNKYYKKLITHFKHIPSNLLNNIAHDLVVETQPISSFENTLEVFKEYPYYKKEIINSVVSNLLQVNNPDPDFLNLFFQNPKLLFYVFKSFVLKTPDIIKNNDLFDYIIEHPDLNNSARNWKFVFSLANSDNKEKYSLMKKILPICRLKTEEDFNVFYSDLKKYSLDDYSWRLILNQTFKTSFFQLVLNQYLLQVSLQDVNCNQTTLKKVIHHVEDSHTNTKTWLSNIIKQQEHYDETVLFFETLFLRKHTSHDLSHLALEYSNFSYLEHLLNYHHLSVSDLSLENFWHNEKMNENFEFTLSHKNYKPLQDYLLFIHSHIEEIPISTLNNIVHSFYHWYESVDLDQKTKLMTSQYLFTTFDEKISLLDNSSLVKLCSLLLNFQPNSSNPLNNFINEKNVNAIFELIFLNKDNEFFKELQLNKKFMENKENLSYDNKKIMHYYSLQEDIPIHESETPKKVNKI